MTTFFSDEVNQVLFLIFRLTLLSLFFDSIFRTTQQVVPTDKIVLSIQYVYERVFLFFAYLSKRVQKYNFFLIRQAFWKKKLFFFFSTNPLPFLSFAEGKDTTLFTLQPNLLQIFFNSNYLQNVAVIAGAKVVLFYFFPNLFYPLF